MKEGIDQFGRKVAADSSKGEESCKLKFDLEILHRK